MSGLKKQVILVDKFAQSQTKAANATLKTVSALEKQIRALEKNARLLTGNNIEVRLVKPVDNVNKKLKQTNNELDKIKNKVPNLFSGLNLSNIFAGYYLITRMISALKSVTNISDTALSTQARFGLYNESKYTNEQLYDMAYMASQRSRTAITDTTDLMNRILVSGAMTGPSAATQSLKIAEIINKASIAGGGTREEIQRSLRQLAQGISSGALQGDELRSIREQTPFIAQMLAEGLNKVAPELGGNLRIGDLKELGSQGEITADRILKAFEAMDSEITDKFNQMPRTFSQSMIQIENVWNKFIADLSKGGGAFDKINKLAAKFADYLMSEKGQRTLNRLAMLIDYIIDKLIYGIELLGKFLDWALNNTMLLEGAITVLGVAIGTHLIGNLMKALGLNWKIVAAAAAVGATMTLTAKLMEEVYGMSSEEAVDTTNAAFSSIGYLFMGALSYIGNGIMFVLSSIVIFIAECGVAIARMFDNVQTKIEEFVTNAVTTITDKLAPVIELFDKLFKTDLSSGVERAKQGIIDKFTNTPIKWILEGFGLSTEKLNATMDYLDSKGYEWTKMFNPNKGFMYWFNEFDKSFDAKISDAENRRKSMKEIERISEELQKMGSEGFKYTADIDKINNPVEISSEDLKLLKDIASRDMLLNMMSVTPQANITFGDVRETADVNKIMDVIEDMVENAFATELVY